MPEKTLEASALGLAVWTAGMGLIGLAGDLRYFALFVIPAAFAAVPLMYYLTRFHLRDVPAAEQPRAAIRFGVIVTAVQFPLDVLGWLAIFHLGWPPHAQAAREATLIGLEIGYFWMLLVPYWMGRRGR
jgi:hypothetical protein